MAVGGRLLTNFSKTIIFNFNQKSYKVNQNFLGSRKFCTTVKPSSVKRFSEKHEWVEVSGNIGTVGISNYAQEALGDVVYAQLPDVGSTISQHDECGALESVKAASEVYTPVSGKVIEKNTEVEETPGLVNQSCYEKGWLFKVELTNESELKNLMTEDTYMEYLKKVVH